MKCQHIHCCDSAYSWDMCNCEVRSVCVCACTQRCKLFGRKYIKGFRRNKVMLPLNWT